ncbi:DUF3494 domain-containing protein, partial [Candidatus Sumerlaeota bacterium]|nr:DUF3494 domain-containing protein [Candidatus Sumerlaeota bacterium]
MKAIYSLGVALALIITADIQAAELPVNLGTASGFGVLAGTNVTNTGATILSGDLGVSPGSSVTGFPPGIVIGTQHVADGVALQAQTDLVTAYNDAAGRLPAPTLPPFLLSGDVGGQTLAPGLYKSASTLLIQSGDLTLDGQNDPNAVWIFQIGSALTTVSGGG